MKVQLHIERLVLEGFAPGSIDGERVRQALGAELTRLLQRTQRAPPGSLALPFARATMPSPHRHGQAGSLGAGVAQALLGLTHGGTGDAR